MICPNCGHNVREGAKFCDNCGIVLPAAPAAAKPAPAAGGFVSSRISDESATAETSAAPDTSGTSGVSMLPSSPNGGGRRIVAIVASVAALLLCCSCVACAALFWYATNQPPAFLR